MAQRAICGSMCPVGVFCLPHHGAALERNQRPPGVEMSSLQTYQGLQMTCPCARWLPRSVGLPFRRDAWMLWTPVGVWGETEALLRKHVVYTARRGLGVCSLSSLTLSLQCRQKVKEKRADAKGRAGWPGDRTPQARSHSRPARRERLPARCRRRRRRRRSLGEQR